MESGDGVNNPPAVLRAGNVVISTRRRELRRDGRPVAIERRAMDLLLYLVAHRDRVVEKDELWREVWNARPVSDSVMPQAVRKVRRALGDTGEDWIATVHGVGYRFVKPIEEERGRESPLVSSRRPRILAVMVLLAVFVVAVWVLVTRALTTPPRVAVLPVELEGIDQPIDWVRYGVLPLIDQALSDDGVPNVGSQIVLATLNRNPEVTDLRQQARILRLNTGAERILVPRLTVESGRYQLMLQSLDEGQPLSVAMTGTDPVLMAVGVGTEIGRQNAWRRTVRRAPRKLITDDPFVNEAYARGLDARLRSRWREAADFFETVLNAAPDLHWARYQLSLVTRRLGDYERTAEFNEALLEAASETGDIELEGSVHSTAGTLAWRRGDLVEAERRYRQAADRFSEIDSAHSEAGVWGNRAILASIRGDYDEARKLYERSAARFDELGDAYSRASVLKNLGLMNMDRGQFDVAEQYLNESLAIRQRLNLPREASLNLNALARIESRRGHWRGALAYQQQVLDNARKVEDPVMQAEALSDLANNLSALGRLEEARARAAEALYLGRQLGNAGVEALASMRLARVLTRLGETGRAETLCLTALDHYEELASAVGQFGARLQLARIAMATGRPDDAQRWLDEIEDRHAELDNPALKLSLQRERAHLASHRLDWQAAADQWRKAIGQAQALDNGFERDITFAGACVESFAATPPLPLDDALISTLESSQIGLPETQRCLALIAHARDDSTAASARARRWKTLAGEHWTPEMEAQYHAITQ